MALKHSLQVLVDNNMVGFKDVFELYAVLCVEHVRDFTSDNMSDEGIESYINHGGPCTVEALTASAVLWGIANVPDMLSDDTGRAKKPNESSLHHVIRSSIEQVVNDTKAFKITLT